MCGRTGGEGGLAARELGSGSVGSLDYRGCGGDSSLDSWAEERDGDGVEELERLRWWGMC